MCTLLFAWQTFDVPIVAAATRDERYDRPAEAPAVRDWDPAAVAPKDAEADGTWIGYNEHGVFVALTNRWLAPDGAARHERPDVEPDSAVAGGDSEPAFRSRGLLVRDALGASSADDAARLVERAVDAERYDGFNLVVADATAAHYLEWDGKLAVRQFEPGLHVVVNVGADGAFAVPPHREAAGERQADGARRIGDALQPDPDEDASAWLERAVGRLGDHEFGLCVHGDGFGTRSTSAVAVGRDSTSYRYGDGPPCEVTLRTVEGQL